MAYFQDFENCVGEDIVDLIIQDVRRKLDIVQAEELARILERSLPEEERGQIMGNLAEFKKQNNYDRVPAIKGVFSDWFQKYEETTKEETIRVIIDALKKAQMDRLAKQIAEKVQNNQPRPKVDLTSGGIGGPGNSPSISPQHPTTKKKIISKLPDNIIKLPIQKATPTTATRPSPSDQKGNTCASHAIGKAILMILHLCDCTVLTDQKEEDKINPQKNMEQQKIIDTLISEVQPLHCAKNPDEFNGRTIDLYIEDSQKRQHNIRLRVNVQTDWETVPHPSLTDQYLEAKKIQRVVRDNLQNAHALYLEKYEKNDGYHCINSHGLLNEHPICKDSVYAVDFIQIEELV